MHWKMGIENQAASDSLGSRLLCLNYHHNFSSLGSIVDLFNNLVGLLVASFIDWRTRVQGVGVFNYYPFFPAGEAARHGCESGTDGGQPMAQAEGHRVFGQGNVGTDTQLQQEDWMRMKRAQNNAKMSAFFGNRIVPTPQEQE